MQPMILQVSRRLVVVKWLVVVIVLLGLASLYTPLVPNVGLPFGYYGKLNAVKTAIEELPDTEIIDVGLHEDVTLEDFWVAVRLGDGRVVRLTFENANIRSRDDLIGELSEIEGAPLHRE